MGSKTDRSRADRRLHLVAVVGLLLGLLGARAPLAGAHGAPMEEAAHSPLSAPAAAQSGTGGGGVWQTLPASGLNRQEVAYTWVGGKFYLAGGQPAGGGRTRWQEVYDPATRTWGRVRSLPLGVDHVQSVVVQGRIYYIGGLTRFPGPSVDTVQIYDPATNAFREGAPMPAGRDRGAGGVAAYRGKIYYYGGVHTFEDGTTRAVRWFDVYDPATDGWSRLPNMPRARDHSHAAIVGGTLYAIGGRAGSLQTTVTAVDAYDFATGAWRTGLAPLPTPRSGFATAAVGSKILVIGGESDGGRVFDTVEAYDPATDTWRALAPLPTPRHGIQAAVCNGGVYIAAGGRTAGGGSPTNVHEVFFPGGTPTTCGGSASAGATFAWGHAAVAPLGPVASLGSQSTGTTITWIRNGAPAPLGRAEGPGAAVNGKLYVFGGYTDATFVPKSRRTDVYDPATNAWTRLADAPIAITHAGVAVDGRVIYLAGCVCGLADGQVIDAMTDVRTYNTETNTWGTAPSLPQARGAGALVRLGRRLHFLGGTTTDRSTAVTDHWVLDLDGGTRWTNAPPLPAGRNHLAAVALGGKIYLIGGQTGHLGGATARVEVYAYDPATKAWTQRASLPRPRSHITESTVVYRGRILVLGGEVDHGKPVAEVDEYDPATDTWTVLTPLPAARHSGVAGVIGARVYYAVGAPGFTTTLFRGRISTT